MGVYPINLKLTGRCCLVVGGGQVALRKVRTLLKAEAKVHVVSPEAVEEIVELAASSRLKYSRQVYTADCLDKCFLVVCATDNRELNRTVALAAKASGALVNVVDSDELSDFTVPSQVQRGDLLLTVSTGGKSPALAKLIRKKLAMEYGIEYSSYLAAAAKARTLLRQCLPTSQAREEFWRSLFDEEMLALLREGKIAKAEVRLNNAVAGFRS